MLEFLIVIYMRKKRQSKKTNKKKSRKGGSDEFSQQPEVSQPLENGIISKMSNFGSQVGNSFEGYKNEIKDDLFASTPETQEQPQEQEQIQRQPQEQRQDFGSSSTNNTSSESLEKPKSGLWDWFSKKKECSKEASLFNWNKCPDIPGECKPSWFPYKSCSSENEINTLKGGKKTQRNHRKRKNSVNNKKSKVYKTKNNTKKRKKYYI